MIRALVVVALLATAAPAETVIELPKTKATLTLADGWTRTPPPRADRAIVEIYKHDKGALLVVTRADVPNPDAWVAEKKQAYVDQVEKGIKASVPGYKRIAKKLVDANGVPALDLEAKREGGAIVVVRVLLFRTYALSLAIEVPKGGDVATARALVKTFAPPKEPAPGETATTPKKT
ncbi:MAG TPA: hypothetical protein VIV11_21880 [Kofleriaceae bacterium]